MSGRPRDLKPRPLSESIARLTVAAALSAAMLAAVKSAATLYFDSDATTVGDSVSGAGLGGTGPWDQATANWWTGSVEQAWSDGQNAVFAGSAGTLTLGAPVTVGNMVFRTTGYTIAPSSLTDPTTVSFGSNSIVNLNDRGGAPVTATISSNLGGTNGFTLTGNGGKLLLNYAGTLSMTGP